MKKFLLFLLMGAPIMANAQVTVFEDSFETYNDFLITGIGDWLTIDLDGSTTYVGGGPTGEWDDMYLPQAFIVFNPSVAGVENNATGPDELRNFDPRTGNKYMASWAAVMPGDGDGGAGPNNDWLVSPPINLSGATGAALSVWVKSMSSSYGLEKYKIGVYTGTGTPTGTADFTIISGATSLTAPYPAWGERTQSLSAYEGMTIRIGIQCLSNNAYMFMVDDFKVTAATLSVKDILASKLSVTPNPAKDIISITNNENVLINSVKITDLNGRIVKQAVYGNVSNLQINVSDLSSGMYMMNISSDQGVAVKKIIKN
jgi:hypothetical protein